MSGQLRRGFTWLGYGPPFARPARLQPNGSGKAGMYRDEIQPPWSGRFLPLRKARQEARERFLAGRKAELQYRIQLRKIAQQVDAIVRGMAPDGIVTDVSALISTLNRYADMLTPWAESVVVR